PLRVAVGLAEGVERNQVDVDPGDRIIECAGVTAISLAVGSQCSAIEMSDEDPRAWMENKRWCELYLRAPVEDPNAMRARLSDLLEREPLATWSLHPDAGFAQEVEDFGRMLRDGYGVMLCAPEPVVLAVRDALADLGV